MGYDTGFNGGWGYVLNDVLPPPLLKRLMDSVYDDEGFELDEEDIDRHLGAIEWEVEDFFERIGIILPQIGWLEYASLRDYPGNRFLPEDLFMFIISAYVMPWSIDWGTIDPSFKRTAELVGYVWGG